MRIHIDFETRSQLSVKNVGGWVYSRHPSTSILCAAFAVDDEPVELYDWRALGNIEEIELLMLARNPENIFVAHNAFFEQCFWQNVMVKLGYPSIPVHRWECTAAKAAAFSLPRSLDEAAKALKLETQKDKDGQKVMMKLSSPRRGKFGGELVFWEYDDAPEDFEKLYGYCMTDVEVERQIDQALPSLNAREQKIWHLDQEINFRGVQLDLPAIRQTMTFIETTVQELTDEFRTLTGGLLEGPSQVVKLRTWMEEEGFTVPDLQAATVDNLLLVGGLPPTVRRVLEIRRALSKISTSKYKAMLDRVDMSDGKLRDILLYYAALTGRWGGRGVQLQNLPRGTVNSDVALNHVMTGDYDWVKGCYPDLMGLYSSCIRGVITASPGSRLMVGDFSAIEAMVLPWLAGQTATLDIFRSGQDIYCHEAGGIYGREITKVDKYERSVGKVAVLALGYQGGVGAFGTMARGYGVDLAPAYQWLWESASENERTRARATYESYLKRAEKAGDTDPLDRESGQAADIIKQRWRVKNALIVEYWNALEEAAIQAVLTGEKQTVGYVSGFERLEEGDLGSAMDHLNAYHRRWERPDITYGMYGDHLLCRLPSGRCIVYPFAKISQKETPWGQSKFTLTYRAQEASTYQYVRTHTYGGKLAENCTQAVARDLLAEALLRVNEAGYPIACHVHDEIVADVPESFGSLAEFEEIMAEVPDWATGIPIKVEAWSGWRYRK